MIGAIIEIVIGWFLTYHVCGILGLKGLLATVVKVIGIIILLLGIVGAIRFVGNLFGIG